MHKSSVSISVVIPVYNAAAFLERCLDSVLKQTWTDFEVLLINDGSTDASEEIGKLYSKKDKRISLFSQKNAGPSAARNLGMDKANGRFVVFIDADDYVDPEFLKAFFMPGPDPADGVVIQGYTRLFKNGRKETNTLPLKIWRQKEFSELFETAKIIRKYPFIWTKMFSMEIIRKNKLRFDTEIKFGEDLIFFLDFMPFVSRIYTTNTSYYHYQYVPRSLTGSLNPFSAEIKRLNVVKNQMDNLADRFHFSSRLKKYHRAYYNRYLFRALDALYLPPTRENRQSRIQALKEQAENNNLSLPENLERKGIRTRTILNLSKTGQFRLLDVFLDAWYRRVIKKSKKSGTNI